MADQSIDSILGEEFLTWLWHLSDTAPDLELANIPAPVTIYMEQRIVVQGGSGDTKETTSVSGCQSPLRDARYGLCTGKKVTRALIRISMADMDFQFTLNSADFCLAGLKTPKIETRDDDDPDALLLEKIYLLEACLKIIDALYGQFLNLRLSDHWRDEVARIEQWLAQSD